MTRKDYIAAAKIVREHRESSLVRETTSDSIQQAFEQFFAEDNPRFNVQTFRNACELPLPHQR